MAGPEAQSMGDIAEARFKSGPGRIHGDGDAPSIGNRFDKLAAVMAELDESVHRMIQRIEPVLKPSPSEGMAKDPNGGVEGTSTLGEVIEQRTRHAAALISAVNEATFRVDL